MFDFIINNVSCETKKGGEMKVVIINKEGCARRFDSEDEASPFINKGKVEFYDIMDEVRIYDERRGYGED